MNIEIKEVERLEKGATIELNQKEATLLAYFTGQLSLYMVEQTVASNYAEEIYNMTSAMHTALRNFKK